MTQDELAEFWKLVQSNYIWIKILEIYSDCYGVQIKIDYTLILHCDRMKNQFVHTGVQVRDLILNLRENNNNNNSILKRRHSMIVVVRISIRIS